MLCLVDMPCANAPIDCTFHGCDVVLPKGKLNLCWRTKYYRRQIVRVPFSERSTIVKRLPNGNFIMTDIVHVTSDSVQLKSMHVV